MKTLGILVGSVLLAACASATDDAGSSDADLTAATRVQMNDVSIVLPLAKNAKELEGGYLHAASPGLGGAMLPKDVYTKNTGYPVDPPASVPVGADIGMPYSSLRAVAYRIDPCFAQIGPVTDASTCQNQLRVIWQAITYGAGSSATADGAIHAFYSLTRAQLTALVGEVVKARVDNGGTGDLGPLAPHPLVVKQGLLGAESTALQRIVAKYAGTKNLTRFTMFQSRNLQTVWDFKGFDIAGSKATKMVIPTLPDETTDETFFVGFGANAFSGGFTPESTAADDMQLLGNTAKAKAATKAAQTAAVDAAFKIENPDFHSPNTIDCASCHLAGPSLARVAHGDLGLDVGTNANAFRPDASWVSAADAKQTTPIAAQGTLNVHVFSYRAGELMIAQRVINETASVVAYANTSLR